ncbi:MAG: redox-regulated ATPase YchF [Spirochaetaceae bacterium]|nr:redox-regulated ATPase YchF [Spirochaetaceae bacterium]MBO4759328.1 redox-regulated ATPase YchF [Spirochaetaceae bacterium]
MAINCGIVGLPNVGKSTIFSALTSAPAEAANYPFCTINPNIGIVDLPDPRLDYLAAKFETKRKVPATVEFVDIAGLVKGASKGEGLGNQFLANIREVGVIAHVVRCFENPDIVHVNNKIDPADDIETINMELAFADLDTVNKRIEKAQRASRVMGKDEQKKAAVVLGALDKIKPLLENGKAARIAELTDDEKEAVYDCHLITMKPQMYVCNVDEDGVRNGNAYIETVKKIAAEENSDVVVICGKFEAELAEMGSPEERQEFLGELGLKESGLSVLARAAYHLMGLRTFLTAGPDECRAWTIHAGDTAPKAAGVIHTDFEKGFIKAETYAFDDLVKYGSEAEIKAAGKYRIEGKEYVVQDGDVIFFKFNV